MSDSKKPNPNHRAPVGVLTANPIALRLMAEERTALEEISQAEGRSMASQARIFFLHGLNQYQSTQSA